MSVSTTEEKKCRVIQVIKDEGYVNKLCSGLNFVTFNLVLRAIFKKSV